MRHEQEAPPVAEPEQIPSVKTPRMAETPASPSASEGASLAPSPSASATPGGLATPLLGLSKSDSRV